MNLLQETEPKYSNFSLRYKYIKNRGHFSETLGIESDINSFYLCEKDFVM